jgi:hypothetical protein
MTLVSDSPSGVAGALVARAPLDFRLSRGPKRFAGWVTPTGLATPPGFLVTGARAATAVPAAAGVAGTAAAGVALLAAAVAALASMHWVQNSSFDFPMLVVLVVLSQHREQRGWWCFLGRCRQVSHMCAPSGIWAVVRKSHRSHGLAVLTRLHPLHSRLLCPFLQHSEHHFVMHFVASWPWPLHVRQYAVVLAPLPLVPRDGAPERAVETRDRFDDVRLGGFEPLGARGGRLPVATDGPMATGVRGRPGRG